jgi:hypothetical protein
MAARSWNTAIGADYEGALSLRTEETVIVFLCILGAAVIQTSIKTIAPNVLLGTNDVSVLHIHFALALFTLTIVLATRSFLSSCHSLSMRIRKSRSGLLTERAVNERVAQRPLLYRSASVLGFLLCGMFLPQEFISIVIVAILLYRLIIIGTVSGATGQEPMRLPIGWEASGRRCNNHSTVHHSFRHCVVIRLGPGYDGGSHSSTGNDVQPSPFDSCFGAVGHGQKKFALSDKENVSSLRLTVLLTRKRCCFFPHVLFVNGGYELSSGTQVHLHHTLVCSFSDGFFVVDSVVEGGEDVKQRVGYSG